VNLFKIHRVSFVKNAVTILQNVRVMNVCLFLFITIWMILKTGSKKQKGILNIGFKLENKNITSLNQANLFMLK
jgi:hypothetical protein